VVYWATGDERALTRFLKANLPLAESFAAKYLNSDLHEEARAAAFRALARAAETYNPSRGSFSHHAHWAFRAELSPLRKQRLRFAPETLTATGEVEAGSVAGASREQALADILRAARAAGLPPEARRLIVAIADCDKRERTAECEAHGVSAKQLGAWLLRLKRALDESR
jgi:hypothetical protein